MIINKTYTIHEIERNNALFIEHALAENMFIYPTDTVYGIGGIISKSVVEGINKYKNRAPGKFYSIIAPSYEWIDEHFLLPSKAETLWKKYKQHHTYLTLLLPYKQESPISFSLLSSNNKIGVRIINHPIQNLIETLGQPFISTSCNKSGEKTIETINEITEFHGICIDGGVLSGKGSNIIDIEKGNIIR